MATDSPTVTRRRHALTAIALLLFTYVADWLTTYEINVGPLYLISICYVAWHFGWKLGVATGVGISWMWLAMDLGTGHVYSRSWIMWEQVGVRMFVYVVIPIAVAMYRRTLEAHRRRLAVLERVLIVCPACGRIGPREGGWVRVETLLTESAERYRFCPTCEAANSANAAKDTARS